MSSSFLSAVDASLDEESESIPKEGLQQESLTGVYFAVVTQRSLDMWISVICILRATNVVFRKHSKSYDERKFLMF